MACTSFRGAFPFLFFCYSLSVHSRALEGSDAVAGPPLKDVEKILLGRAATN